MLQMIKKYDGDFLNNKYDSVLKSKPKFLFLSFFPSAYI